ncbi:ABC transporter ATP-binding protein [Actinomadura terrae]|uniref:ABC transporter ATP-binding protein n=1 Tax=Actinomadura terrae TaxID=604353 RepID=UPI001FA800D0|nr:ABC transporter ATP-binding protein [Actinomadura terrae]
MLFRLLRRHLRPYKRSLILLLPLQTVSAVGMLTLPALNADIVDQGVVTGDTGHIVRVGGVMLLAALVQAAGTVAAVLVGARVAMAVGRDLRAALFGRVQRFSAQEMARFGSPSLITRTTNDVQQVQMVVLLALTMMLMAPIMVVGGGAMALRESAPLSAVLLFSLPAMAVMFGIAIRWMQPLFRRLQGHLDAVTRILRDQITGMRVMRAFVREEPERIRFAATNEELRRVSGRVGFVMTSLFPLTTLLANVSGVAVLWFGGHMVGDGTLQVGSLIAFMSYLMMILMTITLAIFTILMMPRAAVCAERVQEVLDTRPSVVPPDPGVWETPLRGTLELRDVEFGYPGAEEPVLQDLDLVARPGEIVAVIGSTGSGKTTLLHLVTRLFDARRGAVLVNGVDVRELAPARLSEIIGYVPQKAYLFAGTIASNLRYGRPDATDAELWRALDIAQATGFVASMPNGLESEVAQGGTNVSGGQRQRLAIARVLVRRPEIYLFDDSFSALDHVTDAALRAALVAETRDATVVIVAQRVTTIRHADRIVVLDEGRIAGAGTHEELMAGNTVYREIVLSQLTEREAA